MKCIVDLNVQQSILLRFFLLALNGNSWLSKTEVSLDRWHSRESDWARNLGHTFLRGATAANKQRERELISSSIPQNRDGSDSTGIGSIVVLRLRESRPIAPRSCGGRVHATSLVKLGGDADCTAAFFSIQKPQIGLVV